MQQNSRGHFGVRRSPTRHEANVDGGYTLPEILVSIVLMGTVMSTIIAGLFTAINASTISDDDAELDAVLGSAADSLGDALFEACPEAQTPNSYLQYVQTGAHAVGWEADRVQIVNVLYWDPFAAPGTDPWVDDNGIVDGDCDTTVWLSSAKTMQKVIVEATTPDNVDSRTLEIVITDIRPAED